MKQWHVAFRTAQTAHPPWSRCHICSYVYDMNASLSPPAAFSRSIPKPIMQRRNMPGIGLSPDQRSTSARKSAQRDDGKSIKHFHKAYTLWSGPDGAGGKTGRAEIKNKQINTIFSYLTEKH